MSSVVIEHVKVSDLPKPWQELLAVSMESCVTVRLEKEAEAPAKIPIQEGLAAIRQLIKYKGPTVSIEEMDKAVLQEAKRRYIKKLGEDSHVGHQHNSNSPRRES